VHYEVLFLVGILLFVISLAVNLIGASVVFRARSRAERILS
jgi:ABC-type phosphate transport system permease subunit